MFKLNKLLSFFLIGIVVLVVVLLWKNNQLSSPQFTELTLGSQTLNVELAITDEEHRQGLSGREEIGSDGVLFIFAQPEVPGFWMKEMLFDLDMIWIRDGKVVDITENVPAPDPQTPLSKLPSYYPSTEVTAILEVPAGFVQEHAVVVGDVAEWER